MTKAAETNSRTLDSLIFACLIAMAGLIPLIYLPGAAQNYTLPKLAVIAFLTTTMALLIVAETLVGARGLNTGGRIGALVALFVGLAAISFLTAIDRTSALFGHYPRHDGLLSFLTLGGLFFAAAQVSWSRGRLEKLIYTIVSSAAAAAVLAIAQHFGLVIFAAQPPTGRVSSTLGNPVFLGCYLAVAFVGSISMLFDRRPSARPLVFYSAAGIILTAMVLTAARSAFFGAAVGTAVVIYHHRRALGVMKRRPAAIIVALLIVSAGLFQARSSFIRVSAGEGFGASALRSAGAPRREFVRSAVKIIREYPLFGAGPSNFPWANQKLQSREAVRLHGRDWRFDDAHNYWLQIASSLGLPALAVFLAVFWLFVSKGVRLARDNDLFIALIGGAAAFLAAVSFEPASIASLAFFWLVVGIVAGAGGTRRRLSGLRRFFAGGLAAATAIIMSVAAILFIKMVAADLSYARGLDLKRQNQPDAAADSFSRAAAQASHVDRYYLDLGDLFIQRARLGEDVSAAEAGLYYLRESVDRGAYDAENRIRLALAYQYVTGAYQKDYSRQAVRAAKESIKLAPLLPAAHRCLGAVLLDQGYFQKSFVHLKKAVSLDPTYGEGWLWLGLAHERLGRKNEAIKAYRRAERSPVTNVDAIQRLRAIRSGT